MSVSISPGHAVSDTDSMDGPLWLLLDADDTLWENNIFFEEAIEDFVAFVDHAELRPEEVRHELDCVEARNIEINGYGSGNFTNNLVECFELLRGRSADDAERQRLHALTGGIRNHPIRLFPGVEETLDALRARHRLGLVSKGDDAEQRSKLKRSGLEDRFEFTVIVREKDADCYRSIISQIGADAAQAWMIGNSPKSDIVPALEAGLGAVLVPNENTWRLEVRPLPEAHDRFRVVREFADLAAVF